MEKKKLELLQKKKKSIHNFLDTMSTGSIINFVYGLAVKMDLKNRVEIRENLIKCPPGSSPKTNQEGKNERKPL